MSDRRLRELGPNSPSRIFGRQVRAAREQKRPIWSQGRLAEELEKVGSVIDRAALQKIEQGARKGITLEEVFEIAVALDVNPLQLFTSPEDPPIEKPAGTDHEEWEYHRYRSEAGPMMQVTSDREVPAQAVRSWFRGNFALSLGTPDPSLYDRFISDPEHAQRKQIAEGGFQSVDRSTQPPTIERHSLPVPEGRRAKPVAKKNRKRKGLK